MLVFIFISCKNEPLEEYVAIPTPSTLKIPQLFEDNILNPVIPIDNPQTVEGIVLGKKLFFDPILSGDNTQACADCHASQNAFTDSDRFSDGIDGSLGNRNSMPLFNLAWNYDEKFFWDGSVFSLEHQAFVPVSDPIEMKSNWKDLVEELQQHPDYPNLFQQAFQTSIIDSTLVVKAIAQFERTLISSNSKFDKYLLGEVELTPEELSGFNVFMDENKGDCFHCHGSDKNPLWTDNIFHNNGLDETFTDLGLGAVTGDPADNGKFKSPSLRNLAFTAPYMHDGRFLTLEEVINHYSEGLKNSSTIDPLMKKVAQGGVGLSDQDKADLKAFLLSLSDYEFINNTDFTNP
ncbi:cytochrome-c peroxidase [Flaviramulus sp. BrNp1-15]|uniref:cytochrome-c peroxidase n=1 Tax=Flaviramulus sp. BrNp1-15 TaxID=2916754 RepID=UPI001EE96B1C|nr:cytochrome c peroxidase [Flaviramulus sp. BrNp1-15]ULC59958.1 cytochrome-c peroxidase [Flaviramulus sp. BrNp1-15]